MRRRLSILLITMILLSITVAATRAITIVDAQGELCFLPKEMTVTKGKEPAGWPYFDVQINVTDVTKLSGLVISVHWDCCFNCTMPDGVTPGFTAGDFLPKGPPDATGWMITWDFPAKNMSEAANSLMAGKPTKTIAKPNWGWAMNLTFKYIGPTPTLAVPVDCYIYIMNDTDHVMTTVWVEDFNALAPHNFNAQDPSKPEYVCTFHLHYKAEKPSVEPPTCCFTIAPPPPRYICTDLTFDASCSKPGFDGDDSCPITEYTLDFGDGNVTTTTNPIITHHYDETGDFTVNLTVYAPGIGPYIDPSYVDTDTCTQSISIRSMVYTYIDVYTEKWRWPGYITKFNGTGPDVEADAYSPQEEVTLFALVIYGDDIVLNKPVAFEVVGPENPWHQVHLMRTAFTDSKGIANISFRIPWPWEHAEEITFGTWFVNATTSLPDIENKEEKIYFDTLTFEVGWIIELKSVITVDGTGTPKDSFRKSECVGVKLNITNIAKEDRKALITIVVYDNVGVPIAHYAVILEINWTGTEPITIYCKLPVHKWAYVGPHGMVYANAYTKWLKDGGVPWCAEVSHPIGIARKA